MLKEQLASASFEYKYRANWDTYSEITLEKLAGTRLWRAGL